eukprot:Gb_08263 [translate_table: standard]
MPSVGVKLYSVIFKLLLKHRLQNQTNATEQDAHGITSRSGSNAVPANAAFIDGIATKDIHIDTFTSLAVRIFLPESSLPPEQVSDPLQTGFFGTVRKESRLFMKDADVGSDLKTENLGTDRSSRRSSYGGVINTSLGGLQESNRRSSYGGIGEKERDSLRERLGNVAEAVEDPLEKDGLLSNGARLGHGRMNNNTKEIEAVGRKADAGKRVDGGNYRGYLPANSQFMHRRLPIIMQFHGGGFVAGSKDSAANDLFCRRLAKLCDAIVIAVGYRLAPENRYPAAFDDGFEALRWLGKQANLAECSKSLAHIPKGYLRNDSDLYRADGHREIVDTFGASMVEPWLAAHGDPSRCVLLGVSCGANIADYVARKAVQAGKLLEPVKVVAQVLMYPFFIGTVPTHSEIKLANSYFYDKATCILAWKLFLPEEEFSLDHVAANPLVPGREPPLKLMPPTLTVVAELDWMRDRAIAYSEALRKVNIDAPVLEYKDAVHEFATLDILLKSRQAEACSEDIAIWVKKYISLKGHEFSY